MTKLDMRAGALASAATPAGVLRVGLIGWGAIARRFAELVLARNGGRVEICGICLPPGHRQTTLPPGVPVITDPGDLAGLGADLMVEVAGRPAVMQWGEAALKHTGALIVASTSAFTDDALLAHLLAAATASGSQLVIPPGALGGIGALAAASVLPMERVRHTIIKPPGAWRGTRAEALLALDALTGRTTFFSAPAREAARQFPQNANVAVITALAGVGLDRTDVDLVADPAARHNRHEIHAEGAFGTLDFAIESRPLASNPKSSEMTALSLVRLIENRFRPLAH